MEDDEFESPNAAIELELFQPEGLNPINNENIIVTRRLHDGTYVRVLPDGTTAPEPPSRTDWSGIDALTEEELDAAARSDPDNPPHEDSPPERYKRQPQVRQIRRALHLTQEEFCARYAIPLGTLRDWEQGKTVPDQAARAHLHVIAVEPEMVARALAT